MSKKRNILNFKTSAFILLSFLIFSASNSLYSQKETKINEDIGLTDEDLEIFKEQTNQKIKEFQDYIVILGDKSQARSKRNLAEREALKLFYEGAVMETSVIKPDGTVLKKQRPMSEYLYRLKTLPYTRVVIKFFDIVYLADFERGADGKYYATATIFQEFTGFTGDKIAYTDITQKEISVIIDLVEDEFFNEKHWKLFLGDIKATETKAK